MILCKCPHVASATGLMRSGWSVDCPFHGAKPSGAMPPITGAMVVSGHVPDPRDATVAALREELAGAIRLRDGNMELYRRTVADVDALREQLAAATRDAEEMTERAANNMRMYLDLLMQVVNVTPGESRHDSAKRIINQHENQSSGPAQCAAISAAKGER